MDSYFHLYDFKHQQRAVRSKLWHSRTTDMNKSGSYDQYQNTL